MNFAEIKTRAREAVHGTFALPCFYRATQAGAETEITVRHHSKHADEIGAPAQLTEVGSDAYAKVVERPETVHFNRPQLAALPTPITPVRGALLRFPDTGITVRLDHKLPIDGPVVESWIVTRVLP